MTDTNNTIQNKILGAIHSGEIKMRPRWYFVFYNTLFAICAIVVLMVVLYCLSFIVFVMHRNGVWFVPAFGFRTLGIVLTSLPWILIGISLICIIGLELLVRQYYFVYRRPLIYSAFTVFVVAVAGGFIVAMTPLHPRFFQIEQEGRLPVAGSLYRGFGDEHFADIHPCMIVATTSDGFVARDIRNTPLHVVIMSETRFPYDTSFTIGDRILVIGREAEGVIRADGVRKIDMK